MRLPSVTSLDVRFGKEFAFGRGTKLNLDVDVFNLLNSATVLGRQYQPAAHHGRQRAGDHEPARAAPRRAVQLLELSGGLRPSDPLCTLLPGAPFAPALSARSESKWLARCARSQQTTGSGFCRARVFTYLRKWTS